MLKKKVVTMEICTDWNIEELEDHLRGVVPHESEEGTIILDQTMTMEIQEAPKED